MPGGAGGVPDFGAGGGDDDMGGAGASAPPPRSSGEGAKKTDGPKVEELD